MRYVLITLVLFFSTVLFQQIFSQEEENPVFKFYGRGHVDPSHPVFGDEFIRTIIKGEKGAIIDVISHYGIVVIRMDLQRDYSCHTDDSIICLNGKVSNLRNVDHPNVGSDISLRLNLREGTEEIAITSGNMNGTNVLIYLENIGDAKNYPTKGNLKIDWQRCEVKFNKIGMPEIISIFPKVIDEFNRPITDAVKSKFRFSFDNIIEESSHAHFGYKIIEDFTISPNNPDPLTINLTDALLKAENSDVDSIQVESRHYTIFPVNPEEHISYNNDDQSILKFIYENEVWVTDEGLCKSVNEK